MADQNPTSMENLEAPEVSQQPRPQKVPILDTVTLSAAMAVAGLVPWLITLLSVGWIEQTLEHAMQAKGQDTTDMGLMLFVVTPVFVAPTAVFCFAAWIATLICRRVSATAFRRASIALVIATLPGVAVVVLETLGACTTTLLAVPEALVALIGIVGPAFYVHRRAFDAGDNLTL